MYGRRMARPSEKAKQFAEGEEVEVWWPHENKYKSAVVTAYTPANDGAYLTQAGWIRPGDTVDILYAAGGIVERELDAAMPVFERTNDDGRRTHARYRPQISIPYE